MSSMGFVLAGIALDGTSDMTLMQRMSPRVWRCTNTEYLGSCQAVFNVVILVLYGLKVTYSQDVSYYSTSNPFACPR